MLTENKTEHFNNIYNKYQMNKEANGIVLTKDNEILKVVHKSTIYRYKHWMHCT